MLTIYAFIATIFVGVLFCFHVFLLSRGQTTNEQVISYALQHVCRLCAHACLHRAALISGQIPVSARQSVFQGTSSKCVLLMLHSSGTPRCEAAAQAGPQTAAERPHVRRGDLDRGAAIRAVPRQVGARIAGPIQFARVSGEHACLATHGVDNNRWR